MPSSPTPSPGAGAAPPPRRGALLAVVAVVVVAGVVLAGVLFAGVGPFAHHPGAASPVSFTSARQTANSTASSRAGGYNTLLLSVGINSRSTLTLPVFDLFGPTGCIINDLAGNTTTVPGTAAGAGTGSAAFWAFLYRNSTGAGLLVTVTNGVAAAVGSLPAGQNCAFLGNHFGSIPARVVDSVVAANAADHEGGTAFVNAHPNATGVYVLLGGSTSIGTGGATEWLVEYTLCSPASTSAAVEPQFSAVLNGLSGEVLTAASANATCSGTGGMSPSLASDLALGNPSRVANGVGQPGCAGAGTSDWCYLISIEAAGGGLRAEELAFQVETSTGAPVVFAGAGALPTVVIESITGSLVAEYSLASSSWVLGGSLLLSTTQTMVLDLGCTVSGTHACNPTPTGLDLVVVGVGAISGSVTVTLP
ncbi:MAG: hypothetical protein L3K13_02465 [Thermoplasmata archaeon]|nr:hypothetical protein [Thermoplasmata archaeon]